MSEAVNVEWNEDMADKTHSLTLIMIEWNQLFRSISLGEETRTKWIHFFVYQILIHTVGTLL